jgi:hypothetical protein
MKLTVNNNYHVINKKKLSNYKYDIVKSMKKLFLFIILYLNVY